jgi:hypothetical protein
MRHSLYTKIAAALMLGGVLLGAPANAAETAGKRVNVTGEVIDSWCYITEIMFAKGSAHHQCAVWCAAGGIPVGILADDGQVYMVLKVGDDTTSVRNPAIMRIQTHRITVDGDLYRRDGINYLMVSRIVNDAGIVNLTHDDYGIQPGGN